MLKGLPPVLTKLMLISAVIFALAPACLLAGNNTHEWRQYDSYEDATAVVDKQSMVINANPGSAEAYLLRGNAYFELREFDHAINDFSKAIQINDHDMGYFGRGMALGRTGAIDEGIEDLSIFIQRNPGSSLAYTKRGIRHFWNNDKDEAEKDLRMAIELNPRNAEAHDDLGVILAQRGEFDTAIRFFKNTVSIDPTYQKGFHNLALAYFITDRNEEALTSVDTALRLRPENRNSMLLKGNILKALGKDKQAADILEAAQFLPEGSWSEQAPVN